MRRIGVEKVEEVRTEEEPIPEWNILLPGPSLAALDKDELLDAPVVAVNSAIALYPDASAFFLGTQIGKSDLQAIQDVLTDFGLEIPDLVRDHRAAGGEVWAALGIKRYCMVPPVYAADTVDRYYLERKELIESFHLGYDAEQGTGFKTRNQWSRVPWLCALAICIQKGARHVRVFGCDMKGAGYAGIAQGPNAWVPGENDAQFRRWRKERLEVGYAVQDALRGGVEVELMQPVSVAGEK